MLNGKGVGVCKIYFGFFIKNSIVIYVSDFIKNKDKIIRVM